MSTVVKWEELDSDCLVNILGRVGMSTLLVDVPFVCKSWCRASLQPSCLHHVDIPGRAVFSNGFDSPFVRRFKRAYQINEFSICRFFDLISSRWLISSVSLTLSSTRCEEDLQLIVDKFPELKSLSLKWSGQRVPNVPVLIGRLDHLEELRLEFEPSVLIQGFEEIMAQIGDNCKKFKSLTISNVIFKDISAAAIPTHIPGLKNLSIMSSYIEQQDLKVILSGCRNLEYLDVKEVMYSRIRNEDELKQLGSHVKRWNVDASLDDESLCFLH